MALQQHLVDRQKTADVLDAATTVLENQILDRTGDRTRCAA